jgi:hypothetical protein
MAEVKCWNKDCASWHDENICMDCRGECPAWEGEPTLIFYEEPSRSIYEPSRDKHNGD